MATGVLAENVGRGDILLLRGVTNRWGVHWQQKTSASGSFEDVDLTDFTCTFDMRLTSSDDVVYSQPCDAHGTDGLAGVTIPANAFTADIWAGRTSGEWKITATKSGVTELLGWGYWHLS